MSLTRQDIDNLRTEADLDGLRGNFEAYRALHELLDAHEDLTDLAGDFDSAQARFDALEEELKEANHEESNLARKVLDLEREVLRGTKNGGAR
jgi:predicted  nucleic acid-binding Zn-ribbon protein